MEFTFVPGSGIEDLFAPPERINAVVAVAGSTYRCEYTALPVYDWLISSDTMEVTMRDIEIVEITPENFHEGAD